MATTQDLQDVAAALTNQARFIHDELQPEIRALGTVVQALVAEFAESPKFHAIAKSVIGFHLAIVQSNPSFTEEYRERYLQRLSELLPPEARP